MQPSTKEQEKKWNHLCKVQGLELLEQIKDDPFWGTEDELNDIKFEIEEELLKDV